jgi:hypothetical protein
MLGFVLVSMWSLYIVLLLFESQMCVLSLLVSDWLCYVSCFYLFIYLVFLFCSIFLFFGFWCSWFRWFYNFVVPKFFSNIILIVDLTSFVFLFILMLYNIRLIRLDISLYINTETSSCESLRVCQVAYLRFC